MPRNVKLLLTENVEALGIVGDVVNVRTGYARNYLLPRELATEPSEERIKALAAKRAEAERQLAELRKHREELSEKLVGVEVHLTRSCNDQGILYGAVTQHDIADALVAMGHAVKARDVRLNQVIKRVDTYDVHIKLDSDLDATVKLWVVADRKLDLSRGGDSAPDEHAAPADGAAGEASAKGDDHRGEAKAGKSKGEAKAAEKPAEGKADAKPAEGKKKDKGEKKEKKAGEGKGEEGKPADKGGSKWARPAEQSAFDFGLRPPREKRERR
ncbi:MAG: hypothetical protein AMXMBFR58_04200 [Phycisphaerae bacterium]